MGGRSLDPARTRRLYDRIGRAYDLASLAESRARRTALDLLKIEPGDRILNVGCGTGLGSSAIEDRLPAGAALYSTDLSPSMARLTGARTRSAVLIADIRWQPFRQGAFNWIWGAFVLDLLPAGTLPHVIRELNRALVPGGRLLLLSMSEGVDPFSRAVIAVWKALNRLNPSLCAGCRPLDLETLIPLAGLTIQQRQVIVQLGFPAQIILARADSAPQVAIDAAS